MEGNKKSISEYMDLKIVVAAFIVAVFLVGVGFYVWYGRQVNSLEARVVELMDQRDVFENQMNSFKNQVRFLQVENEELKGTLAALQQAKLEE